MVYLNNEKPTFEIGHSLVESDFWKEMEAFIPSQKKEQEQPWHAASHDVTDWTGQTKVIQPNYPNSSSSSQVLPQSSSSSQQMPVQSSNTALVSIGSGSFSSKSLQNTQKSPVLLSISHDAIDLYNQLIPYIKQHKRVEAVNMFSNNEHFLEAIAYGIQFFKNTDFLETIIKKKLSISASTVVHAPDHAICIIGDYFKEHAVRFKSKDLLSFIPEIFFGLYYAIKDEISDSLLFPFLKNYSTFDVFLSSITRASNLVNPSADLRILYSDFEILANSINIHDKPNYGLLNRLLSCCNYYRMHCYSVDDGTRNNSLGLLLCLIGRQRDAKRFISYGSFYHQALDFCVKVRDPSPSKKLILGEILKIFFSSDDEWYIHGGGYTPNTMSIDRIYEDIRKHNNIDPSILEYAQGLRHIRQFAHDGKGAEQIFPKPKDYPKLHIDRDFIQMLKCRHLLQSFEIFSSWFENWPQDEDQKSIISKSLPAPQQPSQLLSLTDIIATATISVEPLQTPLQTPLQKPWLTLEMLDILKNPLLHEDFKKALDSIVQTLGPTSSLYIALANHLRKKRCAWNFSFEEINKEIGLLPYFSPLFKKNFSVAKEILAFFNFTIKEPLSVEEALGYLNTFNKTDEQILIALLSIIAHEKPQLPSVKTLGSETTDAVSLTLLDKKICEFKAIATYFSEWCQVVKRPSICPCYIIAKDPEGAHVFITQAQFDEKSRLTGFYADSDQTAEVLLHTQCRLPRTTIEGEDKSVVINQRHLEILNKSIQQTKEKLPFLIFEQVTPPSLSRSRQLSSSDKSEETSSDSADDTEKQTSSTSTEFNEGFRSPKYTRKYQ